MNKYYDMNKYYEWANLVTASGMVALNDLSSSYGQAISLGISAALYGKTNEAYPPTPSYSYSQTEYEFFHIGLMIGLQVWKYRALSESPLYQEIRDEYLTPPTPCASNCAPDFISKSALLTRLRGAAHG